jgi:hypothetical protein
MVEIKIGVLHTTREIALDSDLSPDDIAAAVQVAISGGGVLSLEDDKGRRVLVPAERLAYVEISPASVRRVGFGN